MFDIFNNHNPQNTAVMTAAQWAYVKTGLVKNAEKVIDYYKLFHKPVKSDHFLIRILQAIAVPKTLELDRYYTHVDARALGLSMSLQMTSVIHKGRMHRGIFYGKTNPEFLIATDEPFDLEYVSKNWRDASAVTVLLHPKSDLSMHLPDGRNSSYESGLSVIMINIAMLAVQYRSFFLEQLREKDDSRATIMEFIGAYVLPNMMRTHMEQVLVNRLFRMYYDIQSLDNLCSLKHPFTLPNFTDSVDRALQSVLGNIETSPKRFLTTLRSMPALYSKDMSEALLVPDIAPTRHIHWLLVLSRLKHFSFLCDLTGEEAGTTNQMLLNQAMRTFSLYDTYYMFNDMLPNDLYFEADAYVQNILRAAGRTQFQ